MYNRGNYSFRHYFNEEKDTIIEKKYDDIR